MAKKTKEQELNLYYLEENNKKSKKENKNKNVKKNIKKERKEPTEEKTQNKFSFEDEIVIGVTKKEEPSNEPKKKTSNKKKKNKPQKKVKKQTNKTSNKIKEKKTISQEKTTKVSKKKKINIHLIKGVMLVALFITVIICAMFSPLFSIKKITVRGNETITEKEIVSLSQIQMEENTFKLSKRKLKEQIKQNAYIDEVEISRRLPSTIQIEIKERKVAYLLEYAGSYVYIDKKGYILDIKSEKLELPILQGAETPSTEFVVGNRLCLEDLEKLSTILKIMDLATSNEINTLITRIDMENKNNIKIIFETKEKIAYVGDDTNLNTKILTIKAIMEKEEGKAGEIFVDKDLNKEYPVFRQKV